VPDALIRKGIKKGDKVVHLMMNSIDWLIAYFGIIRTGAWCVPLNFRFAGGISSTCCDVAEPRCIVFGEEFIDRIDSITTGFTRCRTLHLCRGENSALCGVLQEMSFEAFLRLLPESKLPLMIPVALLHLGHHRDPKPILLTHKNMGVPVLRKCTSLSDPKDNFILIPPFITPGQKCTGLGRFIAGSPPSS